METVGSSDTVIVIVVLVASQADPDCVTKTLYVCVPGVRAGVVNGFILVPSLIQLVPAVGRSCCH